MYILGVLFIERSTVLMLRSEFRYMKLPPSISDPNWIEPTDKLHETLYPNNLSQEPKKVSWAKYQLRKNVRSRPTSSSRDQTSLGQVFLKWEILWRISPLPSDEPSNIANIQGVPSYGTIKFTYIRFDSVKLFRCRDEPTKSTDTRPKTQEDYLTYIACIIITKKCVMQ